MKSRFVALAVFCLGCVPPYPTSSVGDDLINGAVVPVGSLPSTVHVVGNCTSSKVGPRHLLIASHCVRNNDGTVRSDFLAGASHTLRYAPPGARQLVTRTFVVEQTHLHPRIVEWCARYGCQSGAAGSMRDAPDVAVITLTRPISEIPTVTVDLEPVLPGDPILVVGYGCRSSVHVSDSDGQLRSAATFALPRTAIIHNGSPYSMSTIDLMERTYVFSPGPGGPQSDAPGLCPGDSGGPLYRQLGDKLSVIGVNATYTFASGADRPFTNWHSRVDDQANHGVAEWLQSVGATISRSCNHGSIPCSPTLDGGTPDAGGLDAALSDANQGLADVGTPDSGLDGSFDGSYGDSSLDGSQGDSGTARAPRPGEIAISEIMYNPSELSDEVGEWFELHNTTAERLTLGGCTISTRSASEALRSSVELGHGEYATFARTDAVQFVPSGTFGLGLANSNGVLALRCGGAEIDTVSYQTSGFPARVNGASIQTSPGTTTSQNDLGRTWCLSATTYGGGSDQGSPGTQNRSCP